jgi:hypothetical protein
LKRQWIEWLLRRAILLIARYTPDCHDMTRLISQSMDHRLPLSTWVRMKLHYIICVWCERYAEQIAFVKDAARSFAENSANSGTETILPEKKKRLQADIVSRLSGSACHADKRNGHHS